MSPLFPLNIVPVCPRNGGRAECRVRERTRANQTAAAPSFANYASLCPASLAMGKESREGGAASRLAAPRDRGRRRPRSSKPPGRAGSALESPREGGGTAAPEACARAPRAPSRGCRERGYLGSGALSAALALRGPRTNQTPLFGRGKPFVRREWGVWGRHVGTGIISPILAHLQNPTRSEK